MSTSSLITSHSAIEPTTGFRHEIVCHTTVQSVPRDGRGMQQPAKQEIRTAAGLAVRLLDSGFEIDRGDRVVFATVEPQISD
jgi:hypothetical protein